MSARRRKKEKLEQEQAKKEGKGKSPGRGKLDFRGADLAGGSWEGVDLGGANFFRATLTGADFSGATLTGAKLVGANITGATLTDANLSGVILLATRPFEGEKQFNPVQSLTREQVEAGWIEEGQPPVKIELEEDGQTTRTTTPLTAADWKRLGLAPPPELKVRRGP